MRLPPPLRALLAAALGVALAACGVPDAGAPTAVPTGALTASPTPLPAPEATGQPPTAEAADPTAPPEPEATAAPSTPETADPTPGPTPLPFPSEPAVLPPAAIYVGRDGGLWRADGVSPPVRLDSALPPSPFRFIPWAASPDGKTIAFVAGTGIFEDAGGAPPTLSLWMVAADGTGAREVQRLLPPRAVDLTPGSEDGFDLLPALIFEQRLAWNSREDRHEVLFVSAHEGQVDLYAATTDGDVWRLTDTPALETGPVWSRDASKIAFRFASGFGSGAGWSGAGLAVIPSWGEPPLLSVTEPQLATGDTTSAVGELLWLGPADTVVAVLESPPAGGTEVRAYTVGGGDQAILTLPMGSISGLAYNDMLGMLALAVDRAEPRDAAGLYTWSVTDQAATRILPDPAAWPSWSYEGDALAYNALPAGDGRGVHVWNIGADGDVTQVSRQTAAPLAWSVDGAVLAAGGLLVDRHGALIATLPGEEVAAVGWTSTGLFFTALDPDLATRSLWFWDGREARRVDGLSARYGQVELT